MEVYGICPTAGFAGGLALIAANSKDEAYRLIIDSDEYNEYIYMGGEPFLIEKLTYDTQEPCLIIERSHEG